MKTISARNKFKKDFKQDNPKKLPQEKPISTRGKPPIKRKPRSKK